MFNKAVDPNQNVDKLRIFNGLASTQNYNLLKFLITKISDPAIIRSQDMMGLLATVASNSVGRKLIYDYLEENWNELYSEYGGLTFTLPRFVDAATGLLNTEYDKERIKSFIGKNWNLGIASEAFQRALENIDSNIRWLKVNLVKFKQWLNLNNKINF